MHFLNLLQFLIQELVSNIGILAHKSKVFIRPLHFKDHAPLFKHIRGGVVIGESRGGVVIGESPREVYRLDNHEKIRSALFHSGILFLI